MSNEQDKAIAGLEAKMDMMIKGIDELKVSLATNYVQKVSFDDLKDRVNKFENEIANMKNAPHKWTATIVAILSFLASVGLGILTLIFK